MKIVEPQYYIENFSLRKAIKKGEYEVFKNDKAAVGELYFNSILDAELARKNFEGRKINIFSDNLRKDVFTDRIVKKLSEFKSRGGLLKILTKNNVNPTLVQDSIRNLNKDISEILKTTCIVSNDCFAYELVDNLKDDKSEHEAYFCINPPVGSKIYERKNHYGTNIEKLWESIKKVTH